MDEKDVMSAIVGSVGNSETHLQYRSILLIVVAGDAALAMGA